MESTNRAEGIQGGEQTGRGHLKHRAVSTHAAVLRRTVKTAVARLYQTIGSIAVDSPKRVNCCELTIGCYLENGAAVVRSRESCAIEEAISSLRQRRAWSRPV